MPDTHLAFVNLNALVDGFLVELLTTAGGEERHRVRAPELIDVMLLRHLLEPGKIAGIGAEGGIALGGLHFGQVGFHGRANRPRSGGDGTLFFRRLDIAGEDSRMELSGVQRLTR